MKVHILADLKSGPWGGGNVFLRNLKQEFERRDIYINDPARADWVLFNSYQNLSQAVALKQRYPTKYFAHRLGPVFFYHRGAKWRQIDELVVKVANELADLVIFQSRWSCKEARKLGFVNPSWVVIGNVVDSNTFNSNGKKPFNKRGVKLIADSWSSNPNKGFDLLKYLDQNLDFEGYSLTFIGNSPYKFNNIKILEPLSSAALAKALKQHDIFVAPYHHEACSNSMIEALSCGLPVVALNSGSNAEVIGQGGELFDTKEAVVSKIKLIADHYDNYQEQIKVLSIKSVAAQYLKAVEKLNHKPARSAPNDLLFRQVAQILHQVLDEQPSNRFRNQLSRMYGFFLKNRKQTFHRNELERLLHKYKYLIHGEILDIGSKNRPYDKLFNGQVTAIDIMSSQERDVIFGNVETGLEFEDESFDSLVCLEVFEYLDNYEKAIAEIYRLLKPGSQAIITVPFMYHEHDDNIRFTGPFLKKKLAKFTQSEILRLGNAWTVIWDIMRKKIIYNKPTWLKKILYILILPYLLVIKLFRLDKVRDKYYSGLFVILTK